MDESKVEIKGGAIPPMRLDSTMMPPPPPRLQVPSAIKGASLPMGAATAAPWSLKSTRPKGPTEGVCSTSEGAEDPFTFDIATDIGKDFKKPVERIHSESDVNVFLTSSPLKDYLAFIRFLSSSVTGVKISAVKDVSKSVEGLLLVLEKLSVYVDEIPPKEHKLRYGNPAFRDWHDRMTSNSRALVAALLPSGLENALLELIPYFEDSFGNRTRIDYGTGHETNFVIFLYCLAKLGVVAEGDCTSLVLRVFNAYIILMRKIQIRYGLEPAGSRGCWGLDDYQILPFLFGASQLIRHGLIRPKSIHNTDFVEGFAKDFLYFGCIEFVLNFKKGSIAQTSPILNDISAVGRWQKVYQGLLKMYEGEVLSKFPIMQHVVFGSLFKWTDPN